MITDWREKWGIGDFPFVYVQLPNFEPVDPAGSCKVSSYVLLVTIRPSAVLTK